MVLMAAMVATVLYVPLEIGLALFLGVFGVPLEERPRRGAPSAAVVTRLKGRPKLMPRTRAFEARGVWLYDPRTSWSGVRKADGTVVMALWQPAVKSRDGGCRCLLWAPNADG